eukprot:4372534-Lingulodinium_polyedra.AAC.1
MAAGPWQQPRFVPARHPGSREQQRWTFGSRSVDLQEAAAIVVAVALSSRSLSRSAAERATGTACQC